MANIALKDVVVTQGNDDEDYSGQRYNRMFPVIAFGDGALKYDTNGIPLPDIQQFRLKSIIKRLNIQQPPDGYLYKYDPTPRAANPVAPYGTIRIFQGAGFTPAGTVAAPIFTGVELAAVPGTPVGTNSAPAFTGTPVVAGSLVELGNVVVPATTLELEILGA
jgi:hypothetical protein